MINWFYNADDRTRGRVFWTQNEGCTRATWCWDHQANWKGTGAWRWRVGLAHFLQSYSRMLICTTNFIYAEHFLLLLLPSNLFQFLPLVDGCEQIEINHLKSSLRDLNLNMTCDKQAQLGRWNETFLRFRIALLFWISIFYILRKTRVFSIKDNKPNSFRYLKKLLFTQRTTSAQAPFQFSVLSIFLQTLFTQYLSWM